jgi:hypothetical protein
LHKGWMTCSKPMGLTPCQMRSARGGTLGFKPP